MQEEVILRPCNTKVDFDCNICMCAVEMPVVTRCGHLFCWRCLCEWSKKSSICPVCKALSSLATVIPIYSKGTIQTEDFYPKFSDLAKQAQTTHQRKNIFSYPEDLRVFHMQGVEYRGAIYGKNCLLTKIFYIVLMLLFIMVFLLLE